MSFLVSPFPQFVDDNGDPTAFYSVYFGEPDQDPKLFPKAPFAGFVDGVFVGPLATTQILDARGMFSSDIYLNGNYSIRIEDTASVLFRQSVNFPNTDLANESESLILLFDTVADLVSGTLPNGILIDLSIDQFVRTKGYATIGDGGNNEYQIVAGGTGVNDGGSFIDLDNGLQANGIFPGGVVRPLQFGFTTAGWQAAIDFGLAIDFGSSSYEITDPLIITKDKQNIAGRNAQISFDASYDTQGNTVLKMFEIQSVNDVDIHGIDFDMTPPVTVEGGGSFGIRYLTGSERGSVYNCTFKNQELRSLASVTSGSGSEEISVYNCKFYADSLSFGGGAILHSGLRCHAYGNEIKNLGDSFISLDDSINSTCIDNKCTIDMLDGGVLRQAGTIIQIAQGSLGCICSNNTITGIPIIGIFVFDTVGNSQDRIIISNNILDGGGVDNPAIASFFINIDDSSTSVDVYGNRMSNVSGSLAGTTAIQTDNRNVRIFDNQIDITNGTRAINVSFDATDDEYIQIFNNTILNGSVGIRFSAGDYNNTMQLQCYNNNVDGSVIGMDVNPTNFIPKIFGNSFKDTTSKTIGTWQYNIYFNTHDSDERPGTAILPTNVLVWGTVAPVSGTWTQGDEIRDVAPTAGTAYSLVCVASGTPGTWVSLTLN